MSAAQDRITWEQWVGGAKGPGETRSDLASLSYARSRVASALESLTQAAEWMDKITGPDGGANYMEQLTVTRGLLWALAAAARGRELELAGIYAEMRSAQESKENA